jgi:hypothetical protein
MAKREREQFQRNPRIDADVELLLGRFRDLAPNGRTIAHEEIETLLKINRRQARYMTVTTKWRRVLLNEQRIFLDGRAALGAGFVCLTPDDMIRYSNKRIRQVGRVLRKAIQVAALPDPSELKSSEMRNYQARLFVACEQLTSTHKHVLLDLTKALQPPRQLPRVG